MKKQHKDSTGKPRVQFCWFCGQLLYQRKIHVEKEVDGHSRILHKACAEEIEEQKIEESYQDD